MSWEVFSRVLVSLAPSHLLRGDVMAFLSAQVDSLSDLVDYREFAISGKVLVIAKKDGDAGVLAKGWYHRQKDVEHSTQGDTTYTWKHHLEWFHKRKGETVIWLMRRANRALKYDSFLAAASRQLFLVGKRALAVDELLERGANALFASDKAAGARQDLTARCMHARKYKLVTEEAFKYLRYTAQV